jgi:hypothetical protein
MGPTGQTGAGAMVPFSSSSELIITIPPFRLLLADLVGILQQLKVFQLWFRLRHVLGMVTHLIPKLIAVCNTILLARTHS